MPRIFEKSAGGIIYRKREGKIEVLLLEWKNSKEVPVYVIPKWKFQDDETAKETALREMSEETGFDRKDLDIIKFMTKINYTFLAAHKEWKPIINKDLYLFLVHYKGSEDPQPRTEERFTGGFHWFPLEELKGMDIKPGDIYGFIKKNIQYM